MGKAEETILQLQRKSGIARLTLNRPNRLNTIDLPMAHALLEAATVLADDDALRVVLIEATGNHFCGGGDLKSFAQTGPELPSHLRQVAIALHGACTLLADLNAPIVGAVRGAVAGAGFSLMCLADVV